MWSCAGNMPKYYPGFRDILTSPSGQVICLSDLCNILAYHLYNTTLLYNYCDVHCTICPICRHTYFIFRHMWPEALFVYAVYSLWFSCSQRLLDYFGFQSCDFECTGRRLFQKLVEDYSRNSSKFIPVTRRSLFQ